MHVYDEEDDGETFGKVNKRRHARRWAAAEEAAWGWGKRRKPESTLQERVKLSGNVYIFIVCPFVV